MKTLGITVKKDEDFSEWYTQVVAKAELADYTAVSGCMVFRPYSYAIWEKIQSELDKRFKTSGHKNAYFPLFIPETLLKKEATHVKGFSPEVAWVTHAGESKLSERLAIRPTSETIIYDSYSKWVRSWRDLPLLLNQWCSVVRWEFKYPRPFVRTREFLWQEGHTAHSTEKEADHEVLSILDQYAEVIQDYLAIPVLKGKKTEQEKFAGALYTTTLEAFMPDGKALQMGTSHNLGQNFSKAFDINFLGQDGKKHFAWQTSWGVSTRMIGALIMMHGDDHGLVLPPNIAPIQVVIVPIYKTETQKQVMKAASALHKTLQKQFSVELDDREGYSPGWKFNEWELKGVPVRIEIGPRDVEQKQVVLVRRDTGKKNVVKLKEITGDVDKTLDAVQKNLFKKAQQNLKTHTVPITSFKAFATAIKNQNMTECFFCGTAQCEEQIKEKTGASSRCLPFAPKKGKCFLCGKEGKTTYFAKAY